ncbi:hypothetical protein D0869_02216 [Hortaea werneckii]|uniref:Zn(2)-C6 fungal-type domain-containing protein n=4 Tax=Hortaea werneckii TaxID=91943 RepID=A0A3M6XWI3_HORWE|nr:hypothetical protein D0869_02216 [Hortaea werneckii]RMX95189.1 hypothetical protein D0868_11873 [Hortaea werneckii]
MSTTIDSNTSPASNSALNTNPGTGTGHANGGNSAVHLKQKRARSQLSCTPCRHGKLKCNREKPACDQCGKRNRSEQCVYVPPPVKSRQPQNVKGRIRQLEELVVGLMGTQQQQHRAQGGRKQSSSTSGPVEASNNHGSINQGDKVLFSEPTPPSDSDMGSQPANAGSQDWQAASRGETSPPFKDDLVDAAITPFGQMKVSKNEISYVGGNNWNAILNSISELKQDLGEDRDSNEDEEGDDDGEGDVSPAQIGSGSHGPWSHGYSADSASPPDFRGQTQRTVGMGFIFESAGAVTKEQLIAAIPEKRTADRLLSLWFNSPDPFKPIIHAPTFQEEYKRFWREPKSTPTMWLGLLFSILSLAASFALRDSDPSSPRTKQVLADVARYHSMAASAAVLADFTKPKAHTIEALILYTAGLRSDNAFMNVWLSIGLIIRLALRMGYHRDGKHYPNISPFSGEMRRRTWAIISMIDVLISFQLGLPSMVKTIQSDAEPPSNLLDRDFRPDCGSLPQGRGIDELTPSSYTRAKLRIVKVFADAAELSHATVPPAYDEMMKLDRELEEAKAAVPPSLQMPEDSSAIITDPPEQLMCRFNLDLLYLKTKTVLHRRYMLVPLEKLSPREQEFGIGASRRLCTECALRVLQHHHSIYTASQVGGQLESVKWYMGSISTHDFLLAAMIICLELSKQMGDPAFGRHPETMLACPRRGAMMEALERSQKIWSEAAASKRKVDADGQGGTTFGRDPTKKSTSLFDDTEKAARALGLMLEKVKKQFGARGYRQGEQIVSGCVGGIGPALRDHEAAQRSRLSSSTDAGQQRNDASGAPSFMEMPDMASWSYAGDSTNLQDRGIPVQGGPAPAGNIPSNGTTTFAGNAADAFPLDGLLEGEQMQQQQQAMGFSTIGSMLDFESSDLNWEMWDNEITGVQRSSDDIGNGWAFGQPDESNFPLANPNDGQIGSVVAGNALMANGTGPLPMGPMTELTESGYLPDPLADDLEMHDLVASSGNANAPSMEDMTFDLGHFDYNKSGAYPVSQADWEDFRRRRGNTGTNHTAL